MAVEPFAADAIDRRLLEATQAGLPLVPRPYAALAAALGIDEPQVRQRLSRLLAGGAIRRIGAVPNHYALGYTANGMTVWDVDDDQVDACGAALGALDFVSHCYRRPRRPGWRYNLFAMVHGRDRSQVEAFAQRMGERIGAACRARDILYSTRVLKKTGLRTAPAVGGARPNQE
jgi:DNA-binding Lrp family transcriptional regulator